MMRVAYGDSVLYSFPVTRLVAITFTFASEDSKDAVYKTEADGDIEESEALVKISNQMKLTYN